MIHSTDATAAPRRALIRPAVLLAALVGLISTVILAPAPAIACGPDTDCVIGERTYRIRMPSGHDGTTPVGALVYSHGYKGSAAATTGNQALGALADELGIAIIAGKSRHDDWALPGAPSEGVAPGDDEPAYYDAVLADAARRFAIDTERLLATGFSAGGMMTWTLACERSAVYAGFAPVAGTFWRPEPAEGCPTPPASIVHIHGLADRIVPLDGRAIGEAHQGSVPGVLAMYARFGGFEANGSRSAAGLDCAMAENEAGQVLDFCTHSGGHSMRIEYLRLAWERLMDG